MVSFMDYLTQGTRIFLTSWKNRVKPKKYEGNAEEICHQIIKDCWNGRFFQTSTTNFPQFWTRDFGWCVNSLMKLKYQNEVHQTLRYAINRFISAKNITTTITPKGKPFDFPNEAVDSLPWFIHSIVIAKFPYYSYKGFLNKEIKKFFEQFIDPNTGLVRPDRQFSSIKDFSVRKSSCYDNCMVGLLAKDLTLLKLNNPFKNFDYPDLIKRHFWSGDFFYDDLSKEDYISGDANIFPYLFGLIKDKEMLSSSLNKIRGSGLDYPFPLKYTDSRQKIKFIWQEIFLRNYESNSIWTHMGPLYINLIKRIDLEYSKDLKNRYIEQINKHKNFLEVFSSEGKPFNTLFYYSDSGMLWAVNYLTL